MLLTISTTHKPASDLGYILLKNPENVHSFELSFGKAHVFFPEASQELCTACLLLDVDSVNLVRGKGTNDGVEQYVNDRPYVASSFMSVAIAKVFGTALSGKSKHKQELADMSLPLVAHLSALPCRGGEALLRTLFESLGYELTIERLPLDSKFPEWGESRYCSLTISKTVRLSELLNHLYVLIPVMDDEKHYYVGEAEVNKLLKHGQGWLASHPAKNLISHRYLAHRHSLSTLALSQLVEAGEDLEDEQSAQNGQEEEVERPISLAEQRIEAVMAALKEHNVRSVIDLGCGEGRYLKELLAQNELERIVGVDVSTRVLEKANERLKLDRMPERKKERLSIFQGSLVYKDERLNGYDAAICVEVIEHMDLSRLPAFERALFQHAKPRIVVVTTPNIEFNKNFSTLPEGTFRHADHRFEWTRAEFEHWSRSVAECFGYAVTFRPIGPFDDAVGAPTQMAIFVLDDNAKTKLS